MHRHSMAQTNWVADGIDRKLSRYPPYTTICQQSVDRLPSRADLDPFFFFFFFPSPFSHAKPQTVSAAERSCSHRLSPPNIAPISLSPRCRSSIQPTISGPDLNRWTGLGAVDISTWQGISSSSSRFSRRSPVASNILCAPSEGADCRMIRPVYGCSG